MYLDYIFSIFHSTHHFVKQTNKKNPGFQQCILISVNVNINYYFSNEYHFVEINKTWGERFFNNFNEKEFLMLIKYRYLCTFILYLKLIFSTQ